MKNFDETFAKAVALILKEQEEKKGDDKKKSPASDSQVSNATKMVVWKPGSGGWSEIIRGLKSEASVPYEQAISKSLAGRSSSAMSLMLKLGVEKAATNKNPIAAAEEILAQAVKNKTMSQVYGTPRASGSRLTVPFVMSTKPEDIDEGDGIKARNAAAFIHLTLIGAYNAKMLQISQSIKLSGVDDGDESLIITVT